MSPQAEQTVRSRALLVSFSFIRDHVGGRRRSACGYLASHGSMHSMIADVGAQLRKGVVEYCVLGLLAQEPMYGWQLAEPLTKHGIIASIGTLYPMLARLRARGLVSTFDQASDSGPV